MKRFILKSFSFIYLSLIKLKSKNFKIGKNIILNGISKIYAKKDSKIFLGDNLIINSRRYSNFAGLYKNTTIAVLPKAELIIGNNCGLSGVSIYATKSIKIGNNVLIGVNCMIWDSDFHQIKATDRKFNDKRKIISREIIIGDNVWIGGNSIILKGTKIGENSIIAAGSVVSGKIPKNQVWGGNPAKFMYSISE
jgi:acetyltransferase-like isoleucine patch superfamily enzyme